MGRSFPEENTRSDIVLLMNQAAVLEEELKQLGERKQQLVNEWNTFPGEQDNKVAAKEYADKEHVLQTIKMTIQKHQAQLLEERKGLEEIRLQMQAVCAKAYLAVRLDLFQETFDKLKQYRSYLTRIEIAHSNYRNGVRNVENQKEYLEGIDQDLDRIRYDWNRTDKMLKKAELAYASIQSQLELTDYEEIKERLDHCIIWLGQLPGEREESVKNKTSLENKQNSLQGSWQENEVDCVKTRDRKQRMEEIFASEYALDYV